MTMFDERERAFEQMFVHEEEMRFRALARRNKMVGAWASRQLGLPEKDAAAYIQQTVFAVTAEASERRILEKIASDLSLVSAYWTEDRLRQVLHEFLEKATNEVRKEAH